MFSLFQKSSKKPFLKTDIHSHLIPDIDDGVKSWEESIYIINQLSQLGIEKIITTPHIIGDYYPNTPQIIREGVNNLNNQLIDAKINVKVEPGAEYYLDEHFVSSIEKNEELLTFGEDYLLLETPFINMPFSLFDVIFKLRAKGITPILAHPERYTYLKNDYANLSQKIIDSGALLQVNALSLIGHYSVASKKISKQLIQEGKVSFLGSDIHNEKHLNKYQEVTKSKLYQSCRQLTLLNDTL